jgi:hypothetical protein
MMSDSAPHQSYVPPAIADNMPNTFSYLRPGEVNAGFTGEPRVPRYPEDSED